MNTVVCLMFYLIFFLVCLFVHLTRGIIACVSLQQHGAGQSQFAPNTYKKIQFTHTIKIHFYEFNSPFLTKEKSSNNNNNSAVHKIKQAKSPRPSVLSTIFCVYSVYTHESGRTWPIYHTRDMRINKIHDYIKIRSRTYGRCVYLTLYLISFESENDVAVCFYRFDKFFL